MIDRIVLLEKKLAREKKARKILEEEIEIKTRNLFIAMEYTESLLDQLDAGVIVCNSKGEILRSNLFFKESISTGYSFEGKLFQELIYDNDRNNLPQMELDTFKEFECQLKLGDRYTEVILNASKIKENSDEILIMIKELGKFLQNKEEMASFAQYNPAPVFRISSEGIIIQANLATITNFNVQVGDNWLEQSIKLNAQNISNYIENEKRFVEPHSVNKKYFFLQYKPLRDYNYINVYGFDITAHKKSEDEKKFLQEELMNQAYSQGVAENSIHMLHNIGNVLTSILSNVETAKANNNIETSLNLFEKIIDKVSKQELAMGVEKLLKLNQALISIKTSFNKEILEQKRMNQFVANECRRIADIITTQQKYANLKNQIKSEISLKAIIQDTLRLHEIKIEKSHISVVVELEEDSTLFMEKIGLSQTLSNAVVNSIESIHERISKDVEFGKGELIFTSEVKGKHVVVKIKDNGCGIMPDKAKNVFNYGFSTKKRGSGFGLHNCANYMKNNNGSVSLESDGINQGATLTLLLPLKEGG